jgi:FKBP-type peptidyl-prolyl cis-trans isomerase
MRIKVSRPLFVMFALLMALSVTGCLSREETPVATPPVETTALAPTGTAPEFPGSEAEVSELKIEDITVGTGAEAKKGDTVSVNYTGWLTDGTMFDSSLDSGQPFTFGLGQGMVISGWDEGVAGMKVGGKRVLTIPSSMGYGEAGAGGVIPPNATLVFEVDLLGIQ